MWQNVIPKNKNKIWSDYISQANQYRSVKNKELLEVHCIYGQINILKSYPKARPYEFFKPLIAKIFEKSGERFGAMKIRGKIIEEGYVISKKRILSPLTGVLAVKGYKNTVLHCTVSFYVK